MECGNILLGRLDDYASLDTKRSKLEQYVQHIVNEIRDLSSVESWRFCLGSLNPADLPSRGISSNELSSESIWFNGPEFLGKIEDEWPKCQATNQTESEEVLREVVKQPANVVRSLMANDVLPPGVRSQQGNRYYSLQLVKETFSCHSLRGEIHRCVAGSETRQATSKGKNGNIDCK